jgi:hypothetical protein
MKTKHDHHLKYEDLTGYKFGKLTVIKRVKNNKRREVCWLCKCECGNMTEVITYNLRHGFVKSCGCLGGKFIDLTGRIFGRLTVIERTENSENWDKVRWLCECSCGNKKIVHGSALLAGLTTSCGCYQKERTSDANKIGYGEEAFHTVFMWYNYGATKRGLEFSLSENEFRELITANCEYCGKAPSLVRRGRCSNGDFIYNGIDRIDNTKGYIHGNVKSCCVMCNFIKRDYSESEFLSLVERIYKNLNLDSLNM